MDKKFPVTHQQKKLLLYEILNPKDTSYHMLQCVKLEGEVDIKKLVHAMQEVYHKEPILRVRYEFYEDEFYQIPVDDELEISCENLDVNQMKNRIEEEKNRCFNILTDRLIRCFIFKIDEKNTVLFIVLHHSICDGWSLKLLNDKILESYSGTDYEVSENYVDYANKQRDLKTTSKMCIGDKKVNFFRNYGLKNKNEDNGECYYNQGLGKKLTLKIKDFCKKNKISPFSFLYGGYSLILHRYSNQDQITIGVPFANRLEKKWSKTLGYFVNVLPINVDYSLNFIVKDYFTMIHKSMIGCISNSNVEVEGDFNAVFAYQSFNKVLKYNFENFKIIPIKIHNYKSKFEIQLSVLELGEEFKCEWEFSKEIFRRDIVEDMHDRYVNLLWELVEPLKKLNDIEIISEEEKNTQISYWNKTNKDYLFNENLIQIFQKVSAKYNEKIAISFGNEQLTYGEMNKKTNHIAFILKEKGIEQGQIVAIQFERSIEMVLAIYGIVKAGCAYLPLAVDMPENRMNYILKDSDARVLLSREEVVIDCEDCQNITIRNSETPELDICFEIDVKEKSPVYVIYTSGSTGNPKGVINTHAGILNRLFWMQEQFGLKEGDSVLQKTPYTFDVSVWEFFWPLLNGGSLVIAKPEGHKDSDYLVDTIINKKISFIHFVPSMLNVFLDNPRASEVGVLKMIICSGEELTHSIVSKFYEILDIPLVNLYGPTEAAIDVSYYITKKEEKNKKNIPIGKPIGNIKLFKLDSNLKFAPYYVPGELFISGVGLALGYLNNHALTKEKFIKNPWGDGPYSRLYRTGDLVYFDKTGNLIYMERIDNQVKLNGQRIELKEIEEKIKEFYKNSDVVVCVNKNVFGEQYLIAFIVTQETIENNLIIQYLEQYLMKYMVPKVYVKIDKIPLSTNGKVDRKVLKKMCSELDVSSYKEPENSVEKEVIRIFQDVLRRERIGRDDDYFSMGGTSLRVLEVVTALRQSFNMELPYNLIIEYPKVKELAEYINCLLKKKSVSAKAQIDLSHEVGEVIKINSSEMPKDVLKTKVLITGGNGFLGTYILKSLIEENDIEIYCLMRKDSRVNLLDKLKKGIELISNNREIEWEKLHIIQGDLEEKNLGLVDDERLFLENNINVICHCGSNVNFVLPYEKIKKTNVNGTKEIMKILCNGRKKRMVYISTFAIFSTESWKKQVVNENTYPTDINNLHLGYTQSKLVCENILQYYINKGEDISIVRLGRVAGKRSNRIKVYDMLQMLIKICIDIKLYPQIELSFDVLPVDFAGQCIRYLCMTEEQIKPVYHMVNNKFISMKKIGEYLGEIYQDMEEVEWESWYMACEKLAESGNQMAKEIMTLLPKKYTPYNQYNFDMENGNELFSKCKIVFPEEKVVIKNIL